MKNSPCSDGCAGIGNWNAMCQLSCGDLGSPAPTTPLRELQNSTCWKQPAEVAELTASSERTVRRDWALVRAVLRTAIGGDG